MKIAFTSKGKKLDALVDARFGRCEYILILDDETNQIEIIENSDSSLEAHGAGPKTVQKIFNKNIEVLITGNGPGGNAAKILEKTNIKIYVGAADKSIKDALHDFRNNLLKKY